MLVHMQTWASMGLGPMGLGGLGVLPTVSSYRQPLRDVHNIGTYD